jgi:broad specificity phosphatase PhoE
MSPTIHLIRHAQGEHNISSEGHAILDAQLTADGVRQCSRLESEFPAFHDVDLVVASPIKRTVWTALHSFDTRMNDKTLEIIALPELQATSDRLCDTGSSREEVAREFDGKPVDLSLVVSGWDSKQGKWAPDDDAIVKRAGEARDWLRSRPEKEIAVVTHRTH